VVAGGSLDDFWFGFEVTFGFLVGRCPFGFGWNNGLREAVVLRVVFVFEHFFYSSATGIL
jgi:hypothetical protein